MHRPLQSMTNFSSSSLWRSRRIYLVGALGTIIEWYDFALYGNFAPIFARQFFGNMNHELSLLIVYFVLFISYLARPLGGLLYGLIGDHFGRKPALILSIAMMTICMLFIAILPTRAVIGAFAPLLLIIARMMQGFSVGGETVGSLIYVLESVDPKRRGLYGACIWQMAVVGILLATAIVVLLMHLLSLAQFSAWGWRMAYCIGSIGGLAIFITRMTIPESIEFEQAKQHDKKIETPPSFKSVLLQYWPTIFMVIGLLALPATIGMFIDTYFPQYIHQYFSIPLISGWTLNMVMMFITIVGVILFGALSDWIGRKKLVMIGAGYFLLFSYPILSLLSTGQEHMAIMVVLLLAMGLITCQGPLAALLFNLVPLQVRYTVFALGYNITLAIFAGAAPLIVSLLARLSPLAPAFYFMTLACLSLLALYGLRRNSKRQSNALKAH